MLHPWAWKTGEERVGMDGVVEMQGREWKWLEDDMREAVLQEEETKNKWERDLEVVMVEALLCEEIERAVVA